MSSRDRTMTQKLPAKYFSHVNNLRHDTQYQAFNGTSFCFNMQYCFTKRKLTKNFIILPKKHLLQTGIGLIFSVTISIVIFHAILQNIDVKKNRGKILLLFSDERKIMKIMYAAACTKTHQRHMCSQINRGWGGGVGGDLVHPSQRLTLSHFFQYVTFRHFFFLQKISLKIDQRAVENRRVFLFKVTVPRDLYNVSTTE